MTKYQKTDKPWLKIDPKTGFEKQRAVGVPLIWKRNPDLRLHGFSSPRAEGEIPPAKFREQTAYAMDFVLFAGTPYIKNKVEIHSSRLAAECTFWLQSKGYNITIEEGPMIAAIIMEGYPYKRLDGGHVIFKMEKK